MSDVEAIPPLAGPAPRPRPDRRARRIIRATAVGGGGVGAIGVITAGLLYGQAALARHTIPLAEAPPPRCDGRYGVGPDTPPASGRRAAAAEPADIRLAMLGDSSAAGFGVEQARQTPGALLAAGIAERLGRPVSLRCQAYVGATSRGLGPQVERATADRPDLAIILVGANDVTHRVPVQVAITHLTAAVTALREAGAAVVVCTCPDLGTIQPIQPPLRWLARRWSRDLAAAQTVAAVSAGARTVSLGDLLGPQFASAPDRMFGADRYHPSAAGYAAAAAAILPTALAALEGEGAAQLGDAPSAAGAPATTLAEAASVAARQPGTEVVGAAEAESGHTTGPAGRWAQLQHRVRQTTVRPQDPVTDPTEAPAAAAPAGAQPRSVE